MMMTDGSKNKLNKSEIIFILASLVSLTAAIRVEWNTNNGPIVPPTTTVKPVPIPPYREPAPVWEYQDDNQNPNTYTYLLPPPSRPKFLTDNYARAPISPNDEYLYKNENQPNYGHLITTTTAFSTNDPGIYNSMKTVPTLAVYYVPNVGLKYDAVVPSSDAEATKSYYLKENDIYDKYNTKLNGKYNHKLKKYKAYEKMKYTIPYLYLVKSLKQQKLSNQLTPYSTKNPQFNTFDNNNNNKVTSTQQPEFDNNRNIQQQQGQQQQQQEYMQQNKYTKYMKAAYNDFSIKDKLIKKLQHHQQWESKKLLNLQPLSTTSSSKPQR